MSSAVRCVGGSTGGGAPAAFAFLMLVLCLAVPADAASPAPSTGSTDRSFAAGAVRQPFHAVRTLSVLQERVAQGDETAFAMQREVVQEIADELKAFSPTVWRSQRNREALIKYALSGGDPEQLRVVLSQKFFEEAEMPLAEGALAYAEGQRTNALRHLEKVDVFALPPSLAGHVALVKALVLANTDLARVIRLADEARLLSPGTLVEETALRLAMEGAAARVDRAKFEALASRYFRRFPRSPYLSAVIRPVATAMVEHGYGEKPEGARWIQGVVHYLDPQKLVQFYAALAEIGLRGGKLATTVNAARMARKYARHGSPEHAWTQAYEGAALAVGLAPEEGLALLNAAETAGVPQSVGELIAGARAISHLIRSPPKLRETPAAKAAKPEPPVVAVGDKAQKPAADQNPTATKVQARIAQIDKMFKDIDE
jgi:chemotaxis protein MotC